MPPLTTPEAMSPTVSVIIPAYNAEPFLHETMQSIVDQTYSDWELILVNDGSTDDTLRVARSFKDDRIQIIDKPNSGVSDSRNQGASVSSGKYLAFLDADDVWLPEKMRESVDFLNKHESFGMVHGDMQVVNEKTKPLDQVLSGKHGEILEPLLLWDGCNVPSPSSILVRRTVFEEVGKFDPQFSTAADQDFFFRVAKHYPIGRISKVQGYYRVHGNNMHMNIERMESDHIGVYRKASKIGLFETKKLERKAYANLYKILAGSWWKDGGNKSKGLKFVWKSIVKRPGIIFDYF